MKLGNVLKKDPCSAPRGSHRRWHRFSVCSSYVENIPMCIRNVLKAYPSLVLVCIIQTFKNTLFNMGHKLASQTYVFPISVSTCSFSCVHVVTNLCLHCARHLFRAPLCLVVFVFVSVCNCVLIVFLFLLFLLYCCELIFCENK